MTTDLKTFSPLVPIIDHSKTLYSISLNRNDNNNNSVINASNSIRTISFKDLSRQIWNSKKLRLPHANTIILTDSSGKKYALKTASNNMTGSTATFSANTTTNSNTINNSNTNSNNNSNPNSANTNQKSLEMANHNTNNSGGSNSTATTMSEMVNAIEELRRENERIINELGATQDMLDLFERYRELIHKHMDICICAGKDHFFNQWKRLEVDYVNLLPSSNRKRFKNESSAIHQQDPSSLFDLNRHSNQLMLKNPKLRGKFQPIKSEPQNSQSRLNGVKRSNHNFYSPHSNSKFDVTLRMVNNTEHAHHYLNENVNSSSTNYSHPRHSMGGTKVDGGGAKVGGKSLVRTFLDKIRPVNSMNGFSKFPSSSLMLNPHSHSASHHQTPSPVSIISQGSNILIRKRSAAHPHEIFYGKNGSFGKKLRQDPSSTIRISAGHTNGNKKHSKNDHHASSAADQEVERLDKLNNALDQILLGRFDALAQLETNNNHDDNDEDLDKSNSVIMNGDHQQEDENEDEDDYVEDDEDDANEEGQNQEQDEDDDDGNDSLENIKNNVIVVESNHNQNGLKEEFNDEDDNIDEQDDDSDSQIHSAKTEPSTILSAVLKSGLKPYNNFQKMNGNTANNKNGSIATIQVNPTTQIKITNNNVIKENSSIPVIFTTNNSKSTIDLHQPPPPKPVSPSPQGFRQRPHLTNEERTDIINRLKSNESGARIARDYGITKQAVSAIKRRAQLMGDNFQSKYYTNPSSASQQTNGNVNSKNQSSPILTTPVIITTTTVGPTSQQAVQQQPPSLMDKQPTGPSTITINLATTPTGSFSFVDNSLVSRQLKQQKVNATIMKQSNLLAQLPRSTSDLVLPVNPVAILKSKIAAQQKQQQANPITAALLNNSLSANTNLKANIVVDQKRLILPRLLQGTEAYTPTYVTTNNSNNTSVKPKPNEDVDNNDKKEEMDGNPEMDPQAPNNDDDSNDEENIHEPDHDSYESPANNNDEESEEEEEENQDIIDNDDDNVDNFNQNECIEISDGEDHSDDDQDEQESAAIDDPIDETSQEHPESNDDERDNFEDEDDAQDGDDIQESNHQIEQEPDNSSEEKDSQPPEDDGSPDNEDLHASSSPSFESMEFI